MRYTKDSELAGTARVYDDLTEMVTTAVRFGTEHGTRPYSGSWVGREFAGWADVQRAIGEPWADALYEVQQMVEEMKGKIKPPEKVTRTRAISMHRGSQVNVERAINGDPFFLRTMTKRKKSGVPTNATVICNVGNTGDWSYKDIFWRGAAAIAAVDLLEAANYRCEVWIYNLADYVNGYPFPTSLCACRVKSAGDVVDIDHLVTAMSAWFFRTVIFELRKTDPMYRGGVNSVYGSSHARLGTWDKYFDIESGTTPVVMPAPRTRTAAIEAATNIIDRVVAGQKEGV